MTAPSPATLFVTVSGKVVDLFAPRVQDIDFDDIAEQLAKEPRYNGATPGAIYFVAQHLVLGADFILACAGRPSNFGNAPFIVEEDPPACDDQGARELAAYFLLHDAAEGYLKDDTTPKKRTLDRVATDFGAAAGLISDAHARVTERFDAAIHAAAGLPWPMPKPLERMVEEIDRRLLVTEWRQLRRRHPLPALYAGIEPLPIQVEPWGWIFAQEQLATRMAALLPAVRASVFDGRPSG